MRAIENLIRRAVVAVASSGRWVPLGYSIDGEDEQLDDDPVEVFGVPMVYARPASADAEAIVVHVGASAQHPVIVAARDADARSAYVSAFSELAAGEIAISNGSGSARVIVTAAGEVRIESSSGAGVELATKQDVQDIIDAIGDGVPLAQDGGANLQTTIEASLTSKGTPAGTTVLKAE